MNAMERAAGIALLSLSMITPCHAQGPTGKLEDPFLENLLGKWEVTRKVRGTTVNNTLEADWVLQRRFLRLHLLDVAEPPKYEAIVLLGYDPKGDRYVAHWCDNYGAQYSAVGYGKRIGNSIDFVFADPDGAFHNTFTWDPELHGWVMLLESEGKDGKRSLFAEDTVRRR